MLKVGPVKMCFLTLYDWKRQLTKFRVAEIHEHHSSRRNALSKFSAMSRRMARPRSRCKPRRVPRGNCWAGHVICSCPIESARSVLKQFTKMNVRSAQIRKNFALQISAACFFWRSTVYLAIMSFNRLHHSSSFHFSFHFLLFLWVHFCLVRLSKDPRG